MKSILFIAAVMTFVSVAISAPLSTSAQTTMATMPILYSQSGAAVNVNTSTPLPAGYYYLQPGAQASTRVYYYGNGTYYSESTGLFGGSVTNPNGTAGVPLGYAALTGTIITTSPGVPNTGAGGMATTLWSAMIASAAVLIAGGAYFFNRRLFLARS